MTGIAVMKVNTLHPYCDNTNHATPIQAMMMMVMMVMVMMVMVMVVVVVMMVV
jgi:hypothetical protein